MFRKTILDVYTIRDFHAESRQSEALIQLADKNQPSAAPVAMAEAMKLAVRAARLAYLAGRIPRKMYRERQQPRRESRRTIAP